MRSHSLATLAAITLGLGGCAVGAGGEQALVDRAALTVQDMVKTNVSDTPVTMLRRAKAVMVCPNIFKAGFFFGGAGGNCVLLARAGNGTWSYPAFYTIGSGSFGFQFGVQDSQVIIMIMTDRGLGAVMDSQVKLGADAGLAIANFGGGVNGSTTTAVGADIVAFAGSSGLYGGVSLEGSLMSTDTHANQDYYGQPFASRQIVISMQGTNQGADPLREVLTRYGARSEAGPQQPSMQPPPGYAPAYQPPPAQAAPQGPPQYAPRLSPAYPPESSGGRGPVQEQNLPPPAR
jgi:lipid-binding SYLF domain-containing protein